MIGLLWVWKCVEKSRIGPSSEATGRNACPTKLFVDPVATPAMMHALNMLPKARAT